jgi:micrococcal nuclease
VKGYPLLAAALIATSTFGAQLTGQVVDVHDGNTLTVLVDRTPLKVRIAGIDAPELSQPFGLRSKQSLSDLCLKQPAAVVVSTNDRDGRTVASVSCAGHDVAERQVSSGMAWVYEQHTPRTSPLYLLEDQAQRTHAGLWVDKQPVAPWIWRRARGASRHPEHS